MTGPGHYREAERLLMEMPRSELPHEDIAMIQQAAQVHATLAVAAATAMQPHSRSVATAEWRAWDAAAGTPADATEKQR